MKDEKEHEKRNFDNSAFEYLVKWRNKSYMHLSWLSFDTLVHDNPPHGKSRLYRFVKMLPRDEDGFIIEYPPNTPEDQYYNPNFCEVERVVACSLDWDNDTRFYWQQGCSEILSALCEVNQGGYVYSDPFMLPVNEERDGAPNYYAIVKHPMCLSWIMKRLSSPEPAPNGDTSSERPNALTPYSSAEEMFADLELMFQNCHLYNRDPSSIIVMMCAKLEEVYRQKRAAFEERQAEFNNIQLAMKIEGEEVK